MAANCAGVTGVEMTSVAIETAPDMRGNDAGHYNRSASRVTRLSRSGGVMSRRKQAILTRLPAGLLLGGGLHGADDLVIAGAAAEVAGQLKADFLFARMRMAIEQGL